MAAELVEILLRYSLDSVVCHRHHLTKQSFDTLHDNNVNIYPFKITI